MSRSWNWKPFDAWSGQQTFVAHWNSWLRDCKCHYNRVYIHYSQTTERALEDGVCSCPHSRKSWADCVVGLVVAHFSSEAREVQFLREPEVKFNELPPSSLKIPFVATLLGLMTALGRWFEHFLATRSFFTYFWFEFFYLGAKRPLLGVCPPY